MSCLPLTPFRPHSAIGALAAATFLLTGCSIENDTGTTPTEAKNTLTVQAEFYPLAFAAEQVGGEHVSVNNLTPSGAEPHDLEFSPKQVAELQQADIVLYAEHMSAAVDSAIAAGSIETAMNVLEHVEVLHFETEDLSLHPDENIDHEHEHGHEHGHDHGDLDPHFWLDPALYADMSTAITDEFVRLAPQHAHEFRANNETFLTQLKELDDEYASGLQQCQQTHLITAHTAFGYIAAKHGFTQVGVSGLNPEAEPSPARLAEISDFVQHNNVSTIYSETLLSPATAEVLARETGATHAVLDPLEGIASGEESDYFSIMRDNLVALQTGQQCQ